MAPKLNVLIIGFILQPNTKKVNDKNVFITMAMDGDKNIIN